MSINSCQSLRHYIDITWWWWEEWTPTLYLFTEALSLLSGAHGVEGRDQLRWAVGKVLTARDRRLVQGQGVRVFKDGVPAHSRQSEGKRKDGGHFGTVKKGNEVGARGGADSHTRSAPGQSPPSLSPAGSPQHRAPGNLWSQRREKRERAQPSLSVRETTSQCATQGLFTLQNKVFHPIITIKQKQKNKNFKKQALSTG